jgi:hypothetical protein
MRVVDRSTRESRAIADGRYEEVSDNVYVESNPRTKKVSDRLFEGEEAVFHVMGRQIASEKRRNPWTLATLST